MKTTLFISLATGLVLHLSAFAADLSEERVEVTASEMTISAQGPAYLPGSIQNRKTQEIIRAKCLDETCARFEIVVLSSAKGGRLNEKAISRAYWASEFATSIDELRRKKIAVPYETVGSIVRGAREEPDVWGNPLIFAFVTFPGAIIAAGFDTVTLPYSVVDSMLRGQPYRLLKKMNEKNITVSNCRFNKMAKILGRER